MLIKVLKNRDPYMRQLELAFNGYVGYEAKGELGGRRLSCE